jgi:hypothetical protein
MQNSEFWNWLLGFVSFHRVSWAYIFRVSPFFHFLGMISPMGVILCAYNAFEFEISTIIIIALSSTELSFGPSQIIMKRSIYSVGLCRIVLETICDNKYSICAPAIYLPAR